VLHLRIVTPTDLTEETLETLRGSRAVCNVITLRGAAERPAGDVILCDVAREATSPIIEELRALGVPDRGSIAIEHLDSISRAAERAERAAPGMPGDAVVWEEVEARTSESTELNVGFVLFMCLATVIAACGIFLDSPVLIIGAMVLGPEFGPIAALCVAIVERRGRLALRSLVALAVGFPVAITVAWLVSLAIRASGIAPDFTDLEDESSFTSFIASPDAFSVIVAFCAGVAGILSLTAEKSGALIGVLVSVTTIPAAAAIAVAAATRDLEGWLGSIAQLLLNLTLLLIAGVLTLEIQRAIYRRHVRRRDDRRAAGRAVR
jgi:uncharacterized hydrophobic protein (TIGR00271 family)